jgi:murein DD-endopeptidase MepM/ murein hydrolase activator NlpD
MFVIRDYKTLRPGPQRRRRSGRLGVIAAIGVLGATVTAVRYLDLDVASANPLQTPTSMQTVSVPLPLPADLASGIREPVTPGPVIKTTDVAPQPQPESLAALTILPAPVTESIASEPALSLLDDSRPETEIETEAEPAEPAIIESPAQAPRQETQPAWVEHRVAKGESLARIFSSLGLDAGLLHRIVTSSSEAKSLARIRPGHTLKFLFDDNRELSRLELHRNRVESLRISIADDDIQIEEVSKAVDKQIAASSGLIESSLFVDAQKAGLSDAKIMELAAIFGWDIDFALEIRAGDQFRVLFEEHYLDGDKLRDGPILAAEFTNRGKTYRAVRYEDRNGEIGYFDDEGRSKRRAFIRTPIKFARISSRFNPKRWHPVLKRWRSHKGVDYAAPTGTPIKASGDGRVVFRGTKGGYGRTVILQHAGKYTTLYAHMSKYSKRAKVGTRVKQGQVIGYVGKTGLASGPHLHYEFRVNGAHKDPLRVKLPKSLALPKSEIAEFKKAAQPLLAKLDAISADTMLASAKAAAQR